MCLRLPRSDTLIASASHPLLAQFGALVLHLELYPIVNVQAILSYDHFPRNYTRL